MYQVNAQNGCGWPRDRPGGINLIDGYAANAASVEYQAVPVPVHPVLYNHVLDLLLLSWKKDYI